MVLRWCSFALVLLKLIFLVIHSLSSYRRLFFRFNEFREDWEFYPLNAHIPKLVLSILANAFLALKFPTDSKRNAKHVLQSKSFKVALVASFLGEVLYESESKDILTLTCLSHSILYEDLFDELFDKPQLLWFEIMRLGLMLSFGRNLWRTILLLIRDVVFLAALSKLKEIMVDKVYTANQQIDIQTSTLADFKKLIDEAPSAFFILKSSQELQIEFINEEARHLGRELTSCGHHHQEDPDSLELPPTSRSSLPIDANLETGPVAQFLRLDDEHPLIKALIAMAKSPREEPERLSNIPLSEPPVCYDALVKPVEWLGQPRIMVELRRSNYQHIRMSHELLAVCRLCTATAEQKFAAVVSFVDSVRTASDPESLRVSSVLGLYKNSLSDYIRMMEVFQGVLFATVREDRGEKVLLDLPRLESICLKLGRLADIINLSRMNSLSITIAA